MSDVEERPSILQAIEAAETPAEAVNALGRMSLRRVIELPLSVGREILDIVIKHGDPGQIIGSSANHQ